MGNAAVILLALLAGAGLVVQSEMLATISRAHGLWGALLVNTAVGAVIIGAGVASQGTAFLASVRASLSWWYLVPGMIGTFFVLANVMAYTRLGALAAAALIITAQFTAAALADGLGLTGAGTGLSLPRLLGVGLLIAGSLLTLPK